MIDLVVSRDSLALIERHAGAPGRVLSGVRESLGRGLTAITNYLQTRLLIGGSASSRRGGSLPLAARSRSLLRSIDSELTGPLSGRYGSISGDASVYAGVQLLDETTVITPRSGRLLTIPIGKALDPSGVPRFDSPRDAAERYGQDGAWIKSKTGAVVYFQPTGGSYQRGNRSAGIQRGDPKGEVLFVGVPRVTIRGTGALRRSYEDKRDYVLGLIAQGAAGGFGGGA